MFVLGVLGTIVYFLILTPYQQITFLEVLTLRLMLTSAGVFLLGDSPSEIVKQQQSRLCHGTLQA